MKKQKKLNIAIIDVDHVHSVNHDEYAPLQSFEIAKLLAKSGHKITMISTRPANGTHQSKSNAEWYPIKMNYIGISSPLLWFNRLTFFIILPLKTRKLRADLILEYFPGGISLQYTPLTTRIPVVGVPKIFSGETPERTITSFLYPFEYLRLRMYRFAIAYTKDVAALIGQVNPNVTMRVIPLGIGKEYLSLKQQQAEHILFLGKLNLEKKGLDLLLRAYAKVSKKIKYPLVLAGHGKDEKKIRELIKKLRLEKRVRLTGPTYGDKKITALAKAHFLAYPVRYDDVPVVALEALASGLPIVCFDIPELSWLEESFSLKALPYDTVDYSRLLRYASENNTINDMQLQARKYAKKMSREKVVKKYEAFFYQILESDNK